jgi:hypothetical protein
MSEGISARRQKPKPLNNKGEKAIFGGGGSHRRTRLRLGIPCFEGKYREIRRLRLVMRDPALASANKFKVFPSESLRIEAGNFAD